MGNISRQFRSEMKLLPFMLGKLLGGIMAVIGFTAAILIVNWKVGHSLGDVLPSALSGVLGIIIFVLSSRLMTRRLSERQADTVNSDDRKRMSMLSWAILLLLGVLLLLFTYLITR
ncbi:MAG: hypothetical protein JJE30_10430 [Desulfuromonadales bacterium]|nr:hypothetical protein [Desulfuromonadales bacterium]